MKVATTLHAPSKVAIHHSQQLSMIIANVIKESAGSISFRQFMEMALYQPSFGYYVAGQRKLGQEGDFITAPEISPLFSQCLAEQCAQLLNTAEDINNILEFGAGSGIMASHVLLHLEFIQCLPQHYYILDLSPDLISKQKETIKKLAPHLLNKVTWISDLASLIDFKGIILANEVLDAMPVELFSITRQEVMQQRVHIKNDQFQLIAQPASATLHSEVNHRINISTHIKDTYLSELNPNINSWLAQLSTVLHKGVILLIDYGYTRNEYYHADRHTGTLICHYQHKIHNDPLWYPGLQDITANVDFTHVAEAANDAGLTVSGFTHQASFLINCKLEQHFTKALNKNPDQSYQLAQQVRTLSLPAEMGDRFKVIALTKQFDNPLLGFKTLDIKHKL